MKNNLNSKLLKFNYKYHSCHREMYRMWACKGNCDSRVKGSFISCGKDYLRHWVKYWDKYPDDNERQHFAYFSCLKTRKVMITSFIIYKGWSFIDTDTGAIEAFISEENILTSYNKVLWFQLPSGLIFILNFLKIHLDNLRNILYLLKF